MACEGEFLVNGGGFADLDGLRVPQVGVPPAKSRPRAARYGSVQGKFLRGPVPLAWLGRACRLRGPRVLAVALAIWFVAGLRNSKEDLRLTSAALARFGVDGRSAKSRALKALEGAGLIRVGRQQGKNPLVTILEAPASPE